MRGELVELLRGETDGPHALIDAHQRVPGVLIANDGALKLEQGVQEAGVGAKSLGGLPQLLRERAFEQAQRAGLAVNAVRALRLHGAEVTLERMQGRLAQAGLPIQGDGQCVGLRRAGRVDGTEARLGDGEEVRVRRIGSDVGVHPPHRAHEVLEDLDRLLLSRADGRLRGGERQQPPPAITGALATVARKLACPL